MSRLPTAAALAATCLASACVLAPRGHDAERERLARERASFTEPFEHRPLPELPSAPNWPDVLRRAFLVNGAIESAWHAWRAALAEVEIDAAWPNTHLELGLEYLFSAENLKAWDRTTVSVGFDAMETLARPSRASTRGSIALARARAAGERFRAEKFALQERVLETWSELAGLEEQRSIQAEALAVLRLSADAAARPGTGDERERLRLVVELGRATDEAARLAAAAAGRRIELSALAGLGPRAMDRVPCALAEPRRLEFGDAELLALAARDNPEIREFARELEGRADALELARRAWLPDFVPAAGFTGGIAQFVGVSLSFPVNAPAIEAGVERARAELAATEARARQSRVSSAARVTAEWIAMRDAERARAWLESEVAPAARALARSGATAYAAGALGQREWLEGLRAEIAVRAAIVDARVAREKSLARLERLVGADVETLGHAPEVSGD